MLDLGKLSSKAKNLSPQEVVVVPVSIVREVSSYVMDRLKIFTRRFRHLYDGTIFETLIHLHGVAMPLKKCSSDVVKTKPRALSLSPSFDDLSPVLTKQLNESFYLWHIHVYRAS